eukprot:TRINITY_DN5637_c0_g1_i1.p1 TRINITY_DN5637_c0_g1~~TRINITY_DN5637_c0_g1_i1.p1  ORF type:complete len:295 (-),score=60.60 TRINITY_DN5637_c0_g1_i1:158-1042(-)
MEEKSPIRVGGVPEHFNHIWKLVEQKRPDLVKFHEMKCGTGEMLTAIKNDSLDIVCALTEGLVADIAKGSDVKLLGTYVRSPLNWAVSVGASSPYQSIDDLRGKKFGVSRFTSGSHLITFVLAAQRGWDVQNDVSFEVKGNFENLRNSVNDGSTDAFLWEVFTTKPFHDSGEIRYVGQVAAPWTAFTVASRTSILDQHADRIHELLALIHEEAANFNTQSDTMPAIIAEAYQLRLEDARAWYGLTQLVASTELSRNDLRVTLQTLVDTHVIPPREDNYEDLSMFYDSRFARLQD